MSVYLYTGGMKLVQKSGVGQAILHQKKVLESAGLKPVFQANSDTHIIHINTIFPDSLMAAALAKRRGCKVVYYAHSTMEDFRCSFRGSNLLAPLFKRWIIHCYRQGDVILTPTEYSKTLLQGYGIKKPIYSISNGVDTEFFSPDMEHRSAFRKKYGLADSEPVVISVGHLMERKGILDYIELARRMPEVHFFWFGYTSPALIPKAVWDAMNKAPGNLKFPGYIDQKQLRDAYCGADVFAFLSKEETEGIVVLEALACETPVVLSDIPVYSGWLRHGCNAYKGRTLDEFEELISGVLNGNLPSLTAEERETALTRNYVSIGHRLKEIYLMEGFIESTPLLLPCSDCSTRQS